MATSQQKSSPQMNFLTLMVEKVCGVADACGFIPQEACAGKVPRIKLLTLKDELIARREALIQQQKDMRASINGLLEVYKRQKAELDNIQMKLNYL